MSKCPYGEAHPELKVLSDGDMSVAIIRATPYPKTEQERRRVIAQAQLDSCNRQLKKEGR